MHDRPRFPFGILFGWLGLVIAVETLVWPNQPPLARLGAGLVLLLTSSATIFSISGGSDSGCARRSGSGAWSGNFNA